MVVMTSGLHVSPVTSLLRPYLAISVIQPLPLLVVSGAPLNSFSKSSLMKQLFTEGRVDGGYGQLSAWPPCHLIIATIFSCPLPLAVALRAPLNIFSKLSLMKKFITEGRVDGGYGQWSAWPPCHLIIATIFSFPLPLVVALGAPLNSFSKLSLMK